MEVDDFVNVLTASNTELVVGTRSGAYSIARSGEVSRIKLPLDLDNLMIAISGNFAYVIGRRRHLDLPIVDDPLTVFSSTDKGETWKQINDGLTQLDVTSLSAGRFTSGGYAEHAFVRTKSGKIQTSMETLEWTRSQRPDQCNMG